MDNSAWQTFSDPNFVFQFQYPERTPTGHLVEIDDIRFHFRSKDSPELYFEVSRHLHLSTKDLYEREKGFVEQQLAGAVVKDLLPITIAGQLAFEFTFTWTGGARTVLLIEKQQALYRLIYDPQAPLNLEVLSTLQIL